jgi:hypothetical protein
LKRNFRLLFKVLKFLENGPSSLFLFFSVSVNCHLDFNEVVLEKKKKKEWNSFIPHVFYISRLRRPPKRNICSSDDLILLQIRTSICIPKVANAELPH